MNRVSPLISRSLFSIFSFGKTKAIKPVIPTLDLPAFQAAFSVHLETLLEEKTASFKAITSASLSVQTLDHAVSLIRSGGKRVRPYIAFLAYATEGGVDQEEALRVSVALELIHSFALIHDDIIDHGMSRHGIPTIHEHIKGITEKETELYARGDKAHVSEGMALLIGDLIFNWAQDIFRTSTSQEVQKLFSLLIEEVIAGQMIDVSFMLKYRVDTSEILTKNELKTARYSFVNPMLIGFALASPDRMPRKRVTLYEELGKTLGQAFQIQDDLIDIVGKKGSTGKVPFIDVQEGQHTILSQYIFEHADPRDKEVFMSLFGKPVDDHAQKVLSRLFLSTGAIAHAEKEIAHLFDHAYVLIEESGMTEVQKAPWFDFVRILDGRKS